MSADRRTRICLVATVPFALKWFMGAHVAGLKARYDVTIVTSGTAQDLGGVLGPGVSFTPVRIERRISPGRDLLALVRLTRMFRRERFDVVHSIMPKSGLLSMLAARLAGVPIRLHTFTGQVWANKAGLRRRVLRALDQVLVANATRVLADSHSQRQFLIDNAVAGPSDIVVLADGSVTGVDIARFAFRPDVRRRIRTEFGIPDNAVVVVFVGRLSRDKGVLDLARAFKTAAEQNGILHLLVVGPDEAGLERVFSSLAREIPGRVHRVGFTDTPEYYLTASDIVCLPSYREGFGSVVIEGAAIGLPAIASRIYGITDAVEDGVTGILHTPGADREIAEGMLRLASDGGLRRRMGESARARAIEKWPQARVTEALADFYRQTIEASA